MTHESRFAVLSVEDGQYRLQCRNYHAIITGDTAEDARENARGHMCKPKKEGINIRD